MEQQLRMTFDPVADAAYIYVTDPIAHGEAVTSVTLDHFTPSASVVVDFDRDNRLLGIELLGVGNLLRPGVVAAEE